MTQTGALSVTSPKQHSNHQLHWNMFITATSSGPQEQIVLQLWEIIYRGHPVVIFRVKFQLYFRFPVRKKLWDLITCQTLQVKRQRPVVYAFQECMGETVGTTLGRSLPITRDLVFSASVKMDNLNKSNETIITRTVLYRGGWLDNRGR